MSNNKTPVVVLGSDVERLDFQIIERCLVFLNLKEKEEHMKLIDISALDLQSVLCLIEKDTVEEKEEELEKIIRKINKDIEYYDHVGYYDVITIRFKDLVLLHQIFMEIIKNKEKTDSLFSLLKIDKCFLYLHSKDNDFLNVDYKKVFSEDQLKECMDAFIKEFR